MKYKKRTFYNDLYIKVFYDETVLYLMVSTDDVINATNNETAFHELRRFFEKYFDIEIQEGSVSKYSDVRIFYYPLGFSIDQSDQLWN